jgi:hypothetical protein
MDVEDLRVKRLNGSAQPQLKLTEQRHKLCFPESHVLWSVW